MSSKVTFESLGIKRMFLSSLNHVDISKPTPVQENCIPKILQGQSVVACAATGSGKTTAYALPLLQRLNEDPRGIFAVILVPTRELAYQIGEAISAIHKGNYCVVTGGRSRIHQSVVLEKRPQIVVATPGRLADHIRRGTDIDLTSVRVIVFDEVDRLLEDGFSEDLESIIEALPATRQTLMFSATYTPAVRMAIESFPKDSRPFIWREGVQDEESAKVGTTVDLLKDYKLKIPAQYKESFLVQMLLNYISKNEKSLVIVFTNHCKWCHLLGMILRQFGIKTVVLHSFLNQRRRLLSLSRFKSNHVRVLIATDVASRGLDIPMVDLVINENVPARPKDYLHRVGRTARAGRPGMAVTLVNQFEIDRLKAIEKHIERELTEYDGVKLNDVTGIVKKVTLARRNAEMKLDAIKFDEKRKVNKEKKEILDALARSAASEKSEDGGECSKSSSDTVDVGQPPKKRKKIE